MVALQKIASFVISSSYIILLLLLLLLLPSVHSSNEARKPLGDIHKHNKQQNDKLSPQLSFEVTLHGFLLWASMGFIMPVGILAIRMSNREQCGRRLKVLFYIHVMLQILSVLLATAGAVMSIKNFENAFNNNHQKLGLGLYGIIWVQVLIGFLRPKRGRKERSIWFFVHWIMGSVVTILGIINIYTGLQAYHRKTAKSVKLWTLLFTAQVCFIVFLYLFQDKWEYMQKQGVNLGNEMEPVKHSYLPEGNQEDLEQRRRPNESVVVENESFVFQ